MGLSTEDFDFQLPEELIAQTPLKNRSASKMMVLSKENKEIKDQQFNDILDELNPGDALVMNNTRVLPARLHGVKEETKAHMEVLLLKNTQGDQWETLMKPARKAKEGTTISFGDEKLKQQL